MFAYYYDIACKFKFQCEVLPLSAMRFKKSIFPLGALQLTRLHPGFMLTRQLSTVKAACMNFDVGTQAIDLVDTLAFGRLINFFHRHGVKTANLASSIDHAVSVEKIKKEHGFIDIREYFKVSRVIIEGYEQYKAEIDVSLPLSLLECAIKGVGYSENEREACHLAAMHLERCIDSLSIPICSMRRTQEKYARSKHLLGLDAPLPGDKPKDPRQVQLPKPLRLIRQQKLKEYLQYHVVRHTNFLGNRYALLSPANLDEQCVDRITSYCEGVSPGTNFADNLLLEELGFAKEKNTSARSPYESNQMESLEYAIRHWIKATISLPVPSKFGKRLAIGLGKSAKQATIIACMHAELTLDSLGVPLFKNADDQNKHAAVCAMFSRKAPCAHEEMSPADSATPAPLRMKFPGETVSFDEANRADAYLDDFAGKKCDNLKYMNDVASIDPSKLQQMKEYFVKEDRPVKEQFLVKMLHESEANPAIFKAMCWVKKGGTKLLAVGIGAHPSRAKQVAAMCATLLLTENGDALSNPFALRDIEGMAYVPAFLSFLSTDIEACIKSKDSLAQKIKSGSGEHTVSKVTSSRLLEEDDDGKILIPPEETPKSSCTDFHTLISPRKFDSYATSRVEDYLHRHGVSMGSSLDIFPIGDTSSEEYFRAEVTLVVPKEFGERKGVGEGPTLEEAKILACMHAELILDYLGLPLYDNFALQLKHAISAKTHKRWAPLPGEPNCSIDTPSPPYLRKERKDSMSWLRFLRKKFGTSLVDVSASHVTSGPLVQWDYISLSELDYDSKIKLFHHIVTQPKYRGITSIDSRFHVSQIAESGINYYHCKIEIDVPQHRGGVIEAKGAAPIRGDAELLCCMHAIRILDAVGMRVYFLNTMQNRHVDKVRSEGRWARYTNEPAPAESEVVKIPFPLRIDAAGPRPRQPAVPTIPFTEEEWEYYTDHLESYLNALNKWEFSKAVFQNRIPPVGDRLIDEAHRAVDNLETDLNSRTKLHNFCQTKGYEQPSANVSSIGTKDHQRFYCELYVPGYMGLKAHGIGNNKDEALRRASMHCLEIVFRIDPSARTLNLNYCGRQASMFADRNLQAMDDEAKHRILEMYCIVRNLQLPAFETIPSSSRSGRTYNVKASLGEFHAKAEGSQHQIVLTQALGFLINKLMKFDPLFRDITKFLGDHPLLDVNTIFSLGLPGELLQKIRRFCMNTEKDCAQKIQKAKSRLSQPQPNLMEQNLVDERWRRSATWIKEQSKKLIDWQNQKKENVHYLQTFEKRRSTLPITGIREDLIRLLYDENNSVVVLCGTTGCGKTTQVPQYLLDYETDCGRGGACNLLVTQPRRIGATSISKRIAEERLENIGDNVGYIIRLESKPGRHISCITSGVLLRILKTNPTLEGITHIVVDEIHERDINSDFLLILLRELVQTRKDIKIVLMSATLQASTFSDYFGGAPVLEAEGGVYPVEMNFIEDICKVAKDLSFYSPILQAHSNDENIFDLELDYHLFAFLISYLIRTRSSEIVGGSVLVFLPGWEEITRVRKLLESGAGGDPEKFSLIILHSAVSPSEQAMCFQPAEPGKVKIILSTNIAESSVTIDDIRVVIDSGRMKEKSFVQMATKTQSGTETGEMGSYAQLVTVPASRANCVQRTGRAGRTRGGMCYRLYSKSHFDDLPAYQTPELLRQPLDSLCLAILSLGIGEPGEILGKAIECPSPDSLEFALNRLQQIGAIDRTASHGTTLTPLGEKLAILPLSPNLGKMIVYGSIFRCLDSVLTVAASGESSMFAMNKEKREALNQAKTHFVRDCESDQIVKINAYNAWVTKCSPGAQSPDDVAQEEFEKAYEIKHSGMVQISKYKKQFSDIIFDQILQTHDPDAQIHNESEAFVENTKLSENADNVSLVKSILCAGLYPNVAVHKEKRKTFRGKNDDLLVIQGNSVLARSKIFGSSLCSPYVIFEEKQRVEHARGRQVVNFKEATAVSPMSLLLFGPPNDAFVYHENLKLGMIDGWIPFRFDTAQDSLPILLKFKEMMSFVVNEKLISPRDGQINAYLSDIRLILKEILSYSTRANSLIESEWSEKGTIISPMDKSAFTPISSDSDGPEAEKKQEEKVEVSTKHRIFQNSVVRSEDGSSQQIEDLLGKNASHLDTVEQAPYSPYKTLEAEVKAKGELVEFIGRHWTKAANFQTLLRYETNVSQKFHWKGRSVFSSVLHLNLETPVSFEGHLRGNRGDAERSVALIALRELKENVRIYFGTNEIKPSLRKSKRVFQIPDVHEGRSAKAALIEVIVKRYSKTQDINEILSFHHEKVDNLFYCECSYMGIKHKCLQGFENKAAAETAAADIAYKALKVNPQKYLGNRFISLEDVNKIYDEDGFEIDDDYKMYKGV